jgi:signal peptidase I
MARTRLVRVVPRWDNAGMVGRRFLLAGSVVALAFAAIWPLRYEQYRIATGSMAPTFLGEHRRCICPNCGFPVTVGSSAPDLFKASCPNCGDSDLRLTEAADEPGELVRVDRWAYAFAAPRRWQVVLFHRDGNALVKRIAGMPSETIEIRDGDVWADGCRVRKTFAEAIAMEQTVYDDAFVPREPNTSPRWECDPSGEPHFGRLLLNAGVKAHAYTFAANPSGNGQYFPLRDEYAYEGSSRADAEPIHDFLAELEVTWLELPCQLRIAVTDGSDIAEMKLTSGGIMEMGIRSGTFESQEGGSCLRSSARIPPPALGSKQRIAVAFVDRRAHAAIDGKALGAAIDLPDPVKRLPVIRPVRLSIDAGQARVEGFRLSRDVHYRPQGMAGQAVRLGGGEYFVLGDHSPVSEDSRNWLDFAVRRRDLLGRVLDLKRPR